MTPRFAERPTAPIVVDGWAFAAAPFFLALVCAGTGASLLSAAFLGLAGFALFFFRNPNRPLPGGPREVLAPADGRVIEVGEIEEEDGSKALRIGIFLSVFNVHVNRAPLAGRVVAVERTPGRYRAAFMGAAENENARLSMKLETEDGLPVRVVQITGLIARRIVCHPQVGEWLERGVRYGLIRFGSRTDVVLPLGSQARVQRGDRVRGGSTIVAELPGGAA